MVADLKFNEERGVQICELQLASESKFSGYQWLTGDSEALPRQMLDVISAFCQDLWVVSRSLTDSEIERVLKEAGYQELRSLSDLKQDPFLISLVSQMPSDPDDLSAYPAVVYHRLKHRSQAYSNVEQYPGLILIDEPFLPYIKNKLKVNQLFRTPELKKFKPKWAAFPHRYDRNLTKMIQAAVPANVLVIKPISMYRGDGVIIVKKEDLEATLRKILAKTPKLRDDPDPSYSAWYSYQANDFIVEEFVPSTPLCDYDATMRVVMGIVKNRDEVSVYPLIRYWKTPSRTLSSGGSLNELHKSVASPPFMHVDEELQKVVDEQLTEMVVKLYEVL